VREWVNVVYKISGRGIPVFACVNNNYAGYAPATIEMFPQLFEQQAKLGAAHEGAAQGTTLDKLLP
jgi:uncharacterized protein YecE (DUF72 family)